MAGIFLDCPKHGIVASNLGVSLTGGVTMTLQNVSAPCPICGVMSPVINSKYSAEADGSGKLEMFPTPAQLHRMLNATLWAQEAIREPASDQEEIAKKLRKTAEKESPALVKLVDAATSKRGLGLATWISILLAVLTLFISSSSSVSSEMIEQIVEQVIENGEREQPSESPEPDPQVPTPQPEQQEPEEPEPIQA